MVQEMLERRCPYARVEYFSAWYLQEVQPEIEAKDEE